MRTGQWDVAVDLRDVGADFGPNRCVRLRGAQATKLAQELVEPGLLDHEILEKQVAYVMLSWLLSGDEVYSICTVRWEERQPVINGSGKTRPWLFGSFQQRRNNLRWLVAVGIGWGLVAGSIGCAQLAGYLSPAFELRSDRAPLVP